MSGLRITRISASTFLFVVLVPIGAHLLFSSLGFNPTDDGFTLAYSRRLLEGQVPHRDFILIRPSLSPTLHIPFVLWGGESLYLASRLFVWFELALIIWIWILLIENRLTNESFPSAIRISVGSIAFAASAHTFPPMAWHTIDGLFLLSIGVALSATKVPNNKTAGYFLMGMAYLCKQSFLFAAPLIAVALGDRRKAKYWLAMFAPGVLYAGLLWLTDALPDAIRQLSSQSAIMSVGLVAYINTKSAAGFLFGFLAVRLIRGSKDSTFLLRSHQWRWLGLVGISIAPIASAAIAFISGKAIQSSSFGLFGLGLGSVMALIIENKTRWGNQMTTIILVLITAWCASLSIGYNYPVLMAGPLVTVLFALAHSEISRNAMSAFRWRLYLVLSIASAFLVLVSFTFVRLTHIYREQAAKSLTYPLDGILPGGRGIKTNEFTHIFLHDLKEAIEVAESMGDTYVILPDCPGWWAASTQVNPLPIDWAQGIELNTSDLTNRVIQRLSSIRSTNIVIVQKVEADVLAYGFIPLSNNYATVEFVQREFTKLSETSLFEIYK